MEILWTFSIYLESLAILPQLFMVTKTGEAESITSHYLFALGMYRALYILNWVYRYYFEGTYLTARGSPVSCNIWNKVWCSLYNKWVAKFFSLKNDKLTNLAYFKYFLTTQQQFSLLWVLAFWLAWYAQAAKPGPSITRFVHDTISQAPLYRIGYKLMECWCIILCTIPPIFCVINMTTYKSYKSLAAVEHTSHGRLSKPRSAT